MNNVFISNEQIYIKFEVRHAKPEVFSLEYSPLQAYKKGKDARKDDTVLGKT